MAKKAACHLEWCKGLLRHARQQGAEKLAQEKFVLLGQRKLFDISGNKNCWLWEGSLQVDLEEGHEQEVFV